MLPPTSRYKEEILLCEEQAFPAQKSVEFMRIQSGAAFEVESLT